MGKGKHIVIGFLTGRGIGWLLYLIFPSLAIFELKFNIMSNQQLGFEPDYYSPGSGGIFAVGNLFQIICGFVGGVEGLLVFKFRRKKD